MRVLRLIVTTGVVAALLGGVAVADDAQDIEAAAEKVLAAYNEGDADKILDFVVAGSQVFGGDGREMYSVTAQYLKGMFASGVEFDFEWRDLEVNVYGATAVSTAFMDGSVSKPNGDTDTGPWRNSATWTKDDGKWKIVHYHVSAVRPDQAGAQAVVSRYHQAVTDGDTEAARDCLGGSYLRVFHNVGLAHDPSRWAGGYGSSEELDEWIADGFGEGVTYTNSIQFLSTTVDEHSGVVVTKETGSFSSEPESNSWEGVTNLWIVARADDGQWKIVGSLHGIDQ